MEISISRRYAGEILATRAGNAPNKPKKNNRVSAPCIYPFTDLIIFPDGQVGLCCNDCFEVTGFGDVTQDRLMERIYEERAAVEASRTLAERFEEKLRDRLRQIWRV